MQDGDDSLASLSRALDITDGWRDKYGGDYADHLDSSLLAVSAPTGEVLPGVERLLPGGHRVALVFNQPDFYLSISGDAGGYTVEEVEGEPAAQVAAGDDGAALLASYADLPCRLRMTLRNNPGESGFHWVRVQEAVQDHISELGWIGLVLRLFESPFQAQTLIVHEAGEEELRTSGLLVLGREAAVQRSTSGTPAAYPQDLETLLTQARRYSDSWLQGHCRKLPPPVAFDVQAEPGFGELGDSFRRIAHSLTWIWLAGSAEIEGRSVRIRFEGSPWFDLEVEGQPDPRFPTDAESLKTVIDLWSMAVASPDNLRHEAVQRAFALSVTSPDQIYGSAAAVLSLGQYFHNLAQQGMVAEALAALRGARQEGNEAAAASAAAVRNASSKVVDRVFTQLVGAIGLLLAKLAALIEANVAGYLALALLGLTVLTAIVAFLFEFRSVGRLLQAFEKDLDYRFMGQLRQEDIDGILRSPQIAETRWHLRRARWTTGIILLVVASGLGCLGWLWL